MDPFEEFEFKPLTEGLGFHSRSNQAQTQNQTFAFQREEKNRMSFNLDLMAPDSTNSSQIKGVTTSDLQIQNPLPRRDNNTTPAPAPRPSTTVDDILKTLGERKKYDFNDTAESLNQKIESGVYVSSAFEFSAALLDGMLIIASYLAAMVIMLVVTKVDLFANLLSPDEEGLIYIGLFGVFAVLTWSYLVINRMFLGFTPGEWVFDQRLGKPEQLGTASYSFKVALRSLFILATGFVVMPLLSMITRKDLVGKALGVELIKKV